MHTKKNFICFFKHIYKLGYARIFFETGLTFLNSLIDYKLLNNLYIFQSNLKLGNNGFNNTTSKFLKKIKLGKKINVNLYNDSLFKIGF